MEFKYEDKLVVMHQFKGETNEDLQCREGEKLTFLHYIDNNPNWLMCVNSKLTKGMVPINRVKLYVPPDLDEIWYHGEISRDEAFARLSLSIDGTFLVRLSSKYRGDFSVCVRFNDTTEVYHVIRSELGYSLDEESWFDTLTKLIEHYQESEDGLCCMLGKCCENVQKAHIKYLEENRFLIKDVELKLGVKIGSGEFCEVYEAIFRETTVAVKCFKKNINFEAENLFISESSLMAKLKHPNLVTFIGMSVHRDHIYLVTELMENGSLENYLQSRGRNIIKTSDQIRFATDCCLGMCYLEEHCVVHRDLAARNILLNKELVAKVSDFGLARMDNSRLPLNDNNNHNGDLQVPCDVINELASLSWPSISDTDSGRIPVKWTSPESLSDKTYTNKSDVWSFGILLWEIFTFGRTPYPKTSTNNVKRYILKGHRMECPPDTPKFIEDLTKMCWSANPGDRPSFAQIRTILTSI